MNIQITTAAENEASEVLGIFTRAREKMEYLPIVHTHEENKAYFKDLVKSGTVLVIKQNNRYLGFTQLKDSWIMHLYIDPTFQNQGFGKVLLDNLKILSPSELNLWVFEQNTRAIKFYEREGFNLKEKRSKDQSTNEENLPDRRYRWSYENK